MNAQELQSVAAEAMHATAQYEALTNKVQVESRLFDYAAPLPPMPHYRPREWETDTKEQR